MGLISQFPPSTIRSCPVMNSFASRKMADDAISNLVPARPRGTTPLQAGTANRHNRKQTGTTASATIELPPPQNNPSTNHSAGRRHFRYGTRLHRRRWMLCPALLPAPCDHPLLYTHCFSPTAFHPPHHRGCRFVVDAAAELGEARRVCDGPRRDAVHADVVLAPLQRHAAGIQLEGAEGQQQASVKCGSTTNDRSR